MADAGYLSVQVIQRFFSENLHFCACAGNTVHCAGIRPENNTVIFLIIENHTTSLNLNLLYLLPTINLTVTTGT